MNLALVLASVSRMTELLIGVGLVGGILGVACIAKAINSRREARESGADRGDGKRDSRRQAAAG